MEASKVCCPPGESNSKACCKCGPGWTCVIKKIEDPQPDAKPFSTCDTESCVCITDDGSKTRVESEGGYCVCGEGYACSFMKTEGPDAGKVFFECGNGCRCEVSGSGNQVIVLKDDA